MRFPHLLRPLALAATVGFLVACDDDDTTTPTPVATTVQVVSGSGQTGAVGTALASPLIVRVLDQSGNPFQGATVTWAVTGGGGTLSSATTTTGSNGQAQVNWTLGATAGANTATATVAGRTPVTFTATGT